MNTKITKSTATGMFPLNRVSGINGSSGMVENPFWNPTEILKIMMIKTSPTMTMPRAFAESSILKNPKNVTIIHAITDHTHQGACIPKVLASRSFAATPIKT
ncbi:hypothetical protein D3C76_1515090 [compost metagenome]